MRLFLQAWSANLGIALSKAVSATAFLALAVAAGILVAPAVRPTPPVVVQADDDKPNTTGAAGAQDARIVKLDSVGQTKGGIETTDPEPTTFQTQARAYGTVLPLDRIVALYNSALTGAAQLESAKAKQGESRAASDRAQALLKVFSTAKAQAEAAAATANIDTAGVASAKAQIEALRNTATQEWGPVLGDAIVERKPLAVGIVARRTFLVQLSLQPGSVVTPPPKLSFALGEGPQIEGHFVTEAAQTDPRLQTIGYIYAVPAAAGLLPGTSVLALLPKGSAEAGFGIPSSAVVWQAGKPWMYVRTGRNRFERRSIGEAAMPTPDGGYIVPAQRFAGEEGKALVTAGAQVLLSQEMKAQIPSEDND